MASIIILNAEPISAIGNLTSNQTSVSKSMALATMLSPMTQIKSGLNRVRRLNSLTDMKIADKNCRSMSLLCLVKTRETLRLNTLLRRYHVVCKTLLLTLISLKLF